MGILISGAAAAATITADRDGEITVITVEGRLFADDADQFRSVTTNAVARAAGAPVFVVLSGPGGALLTGLQIGADIRARHWSTVVPAGSSCASACALAWLGGVRRIAFESARIGLHAGYTRATDGTTQEAGTGNAFIGAYMRDLGLSIAAIAYATKAAPDEMTWLDEAAAKTIDLSMEILPEDGRLGTSVRSPHQASAPPVAQATIDADILLGAPGDNATPAQRRAAAVVLDYFAAWSAGNDIARLRLRAAYAEQVDYYGSQIDRTAVLREKERFMARWPSRRFSVRAGSGAVRCDRDICLVQGTLDWSCADGARNARSVGAATFAFMVSADGHVVAEQGAVLRRAPDSADVARLAPTGAGGAVPSSATLNPHAPETP